MNGIAFRSGQLTVAAYKTTVSESCFFFTMASAMGDLVMRISMLVQRGFICQRCGVEMDGEMTESPRSCRSCEELEAANQREDMEAPARPIVRVHAARP